MNSPKVERRGWISWEAYWFNSGSLFDLAVCRLVTVVFQLLLLFRQNTLQKLYDYAAIPSEGFEPLPLLHLFNLPFGWDRPPVVCLEIAYWVTIISGFLTIIGLKTRPNFIVFAVGNLFMQTYKYSFGELHHPEAMMMIALFALAFGPSGKVLSLDALLQYWTKTGALKKAANPIRWLNQKNTFAWWPVLLIKWMFSLVYFSAAISKLMRGIDPRTFNLDWVNGYTLQYHLLKDGIKHGTELGVWLGQFHIPAIMFSWTAVLFEFFFFLVLIFPRAALLFIPLGACFHTAIYLAQRAPFFQYIAIYSIFVPWSKVFRQVYTLCKGLVVQKSLKR